MITNSRNGNSQNTKLAMLIYCMCCSTLLYPAEDQKQQLDDVVKKLLESQQENIVSIFESLPVTSRISMTSAGDILILIHGDSAKRIVVLRADKKGAIIWNENKVLISTSGYIYSPSCYPDSDNGCFIVWKQISPDGIFIRRIGAGGETRWESVFSPLL